MTSSTHLLSSHLDIKLCMQLAQKIEGRRTAEEEGDGHCDKVLAVAAHPVLKIIASAGLSKDCTIKIWENKS